MTRNECFTDGKQDRRGHDLKSIKKKSLFSIMPILTIQISSPNSTRISDASVTSHDLLSLICKYEGAINVLLVLVLVLITAYYAYETHKLTEMNQKQVECEMKEYLLRTVQPIIKELKRKEEIFRNRDYLWTWDKEGEENLRIDEPGEFNHKPEPLSDDSLLKSSEFTECCKYYELEYQPDLKKLIAQLKDLVSYTDTYLKEKGYYKELYDIILQDGNEMDEQDCNKQVRYFITKKMVIGRIDNYKERQRSNESLKNEFKTTFPHTKIENLTFIYSKIDGMNKNSKDLVKQIDIFSKKLESHAEHVRCKLDEITLELSRKYSISPYRYIKENESPIRAIR